MSRLAATRLLAAIAMAMAATFAIVTSISPQAAADTGGMTWSQEGPVDAAEGTPDALSCPTTTFCVEVNETGHAVIYSEGSWSSPVTIDPNETSLTAVSCPTTGFCVAVDVNGDAVTYSDGLWSLPASIDPNGDDPTSISCPTTSFCIAVDHTGEVLWYEDGKWSSASLDSDGGGLTAISCPSPTMCFAVDASGWALEWPGTLSAQGAPIGWEKTRIAYPVGSALTDVSCASNSFCIAVNNDGGGYLWLGDGWQTPESPPGLPDIEKVSCPTSNFCLLVGGAEAVTYTDATWLPPTSIDPNRALGAVSCATSTFCVAVDYEGDAVLYRGAWSSPASIDPTHEGGLTSVSCPTARFCVAVDEAGYAVSFNDGVWSPPDEIDPGGILVSVSCPTTTFCVALDYWGSAVIYADGSWAPPASIDTYGAGLSAVSCPTSSFCVAVDENGDAVTYLAGSWSSPALIDPGHMLTSVSCPTPDWCAAVDHSGQALTYVAGTWSPAVPVDARGDLTAVSCTTSFCAALDGSGNALTYSAGSWSSPLDVNQSVTLYSVSCPTSSFCVAVGAAGSTLTYEGGSWVLGGVGDPASNLSAVSCPTSSFCVAVDSYNAYSYALATNTAIGALTPSPAVGQPIAVGVVVAGSSTGTGSPTPTGQVMVSDGTRSCEAALSGANGEATGSCAITESDAGSYELTASYLGDSSFSESAATSPVHLTVAKATSATALTLSSAEVTYGNEHSEQLSVTVVPEYPGVTPTGTVTVSEGTTSLCTIQLSQGQGSCHLSAAQLATGDHDVAAAYGGTSAFDASGSRDAVLTVRKATSMTELAFSTAKVTYGDEGSEQLSVSVLPEFSGVTPTSTVVLNERTTRLCSIQLAQGRGSCTLSSRELPVGTFALAADYNGSVGFEASVSSTASLTVAKENSKVVFDASSSKLTYGNEGTEHLSVTVLPEFKGVIPTGLVIVSKSSERLCAIPLSEGRGTCVLSRTELKVGSYRLEATYAGSHILRGSTAARELVVGHATRRAG